MPWTVAGVSGVVSPPITPAQPLRNPTTSKPCTPIAERTAARIAAFRPGASPPAVRMPMRFTDQTLPGGPSRASRPRDTVSKSESYRRSTRPASRARESDLNVRRWMPKALVLCLAMSALLPVTPAGAHDIYHLVDEERELELPEVQRLVGLHREVHRLFARPGPPG